MEKDYNEKLELEQHVLVPKRESTFRVKSRRRLDSLPGAPDAYR